MSLPELLCTVAVAVVLIALAIPAIGTVRLKQREVGALANLRSIGISLNNYGDTYRDALP
jgi:Tfp pilus assembly protein FimT